MHAALLTLCVCMYIHLITQRPTRKMEYRFLVQAIRALTLGLRRSTVPTLSPSFCLQSSMTGGIRTTPHLNKARHKANVTISQAPEMQLLSIFKRTHSSFSSGTQSLNEQTTRRRTSTRLFSVTLILLSDETENARATK